MLGADLRQRSHCAPVDQGRDHLIGADRDAISQRKMQMGGVEIGHSDLVDQPLFA